MQDSLSGIEVVKAYGAETREAAKFQVHLNDLKKVNVRRTVLNQDIYVMDADGAGQIRLTNEPGLDAAPSWSPDGSLIAFVRVIPGPGDSPYGGDEEIFVMNAAGSGVKRLTDSFWVDYAPLWRPVRSN